MSNYKFTDESYTPSEGDTRTFLKVLEYLRHASVSAMLASDPDSFPDERSAVEFILATGDRYIADMEDDLLEAVETEEAATSTAHAIATGCAFAALAHYFPVVRTWL